MLCHFLRILHIALSYRLGRHTDPCCVPRAKTSSACMGCVRGGVKVKKNSETDPNNLGVTLCLLSPEVTLPPPSQSTALTCVPKVA